MAIEYYSSIDLNKNELQNAALQVLSTKPSSPATGQIFFDSDVTQVQVYNGSAWQGLVTEVVDTDDIFNAGLRIGRDSHNMLDFETADNTIDIYLNNAKDFTFTANTFTAQNGSTIAAQALTATTGTFSGILRVTNETDATSTTDGALRSAGGLSVALDAVIGNDLSLLSDGAKFALGAGKDVTITHDGGTGGTLASAGNFTVDSTAGTMTIDGHTGVSVRSVADVALTTTGSAGEIHLVTAHTAGRAVHIDANANAGSIVDIDAGILDIDVTGVTTFDTTELKLGSAGGLRITDTTASSATEGAAINLIADDGAAMADDHRLGVINFRGAEDASSTLTLGASIEAFCDAGWSASENGARLVFSTTDANNDTDIALTLDSNQKASFGADVAIAGNLTVAGTTTTENTTIIESTVSVLQFEGANDNDHETILKVVEPSADTTFSLPALSAGNFFIPAIAGAATDASAAVTAAEFALLDGGSTVGTTAISDNDGIVSNDAGTMKHTKVQTYQTYFDANSVGGANIVTTGALGTGTIAAGFGAIDNGTSGIRTATFTAETAFVPSADDGATLGSANLNFSDVFLADAAVLNFGDDQDVKLTHVADAGLLLNSTMKIQFNDASQFIQGSSATELQISATDQINLDSTLIDLNGNLDVSGTALVTGVLTVASNIVHAGDTNNLIGFTTDTQTFTTGGTARLTINDSKAVFQGEVEAASLDISGDVDVDGTLETDALTIGGAAVLAQATASAVGAVELATAAEVLTGTDTARVVTADTLAARSVVAVIDVSSLTDANIVTIPHNLGTADVMVQVYDITTEANIMCDIARTTDDFSTASTSSISIDFGTAPPNDCRCLITSLKGASASGTVAYT